VSGRAALEHFDALLDLGEAERARALERLSREDPELGSLVAAWIRSELSPDPRLEPIHYAPLLPLLDEPDEKIAPGERIGPYRLVHEIGRGGMGSVWLAERVDGEFVQQVALKLIRPDLGSPEAEPRFRRERQILAALKHPNIAQLLDGGVSADGRLWLAMEYIAGHSLRELVQRGPMAPKRLIGLASQVASALAHAHAAGVVHRDLKPDNVMIANEGFAKVLDFGVAKLLDDGADATGGHAATQPGRMIGTTPYMSPEQAGGEHVDFRSDQFALGAVLYEAATGSPAFARETPSQTVAAVLRDAPPAIDSLADSLPPGLVRIVRRCLEKDPKDRYGATSDLAHDLVELERDVLPASAAPRGVHAGTFALVIAIALAFAAAGWWLGMRTAPGEAAPVRAAFSAELSIAPAERLWFGAFSLHAFTLSPDARRVVFAGFQGGKRLLFLRERGAHEANPLPGSDGGSNPVFSPDGEWIAFLANEKLKKIPVGGGGATVLADAPSALGGLAWPDARRILYSPTPGVGIWEVSPAGGETKKLTEPDVSEGEASHVWPFMVPGTNLLLYAAEIEAADTFDAARIYAFDLSSGRRTLLVDGGSDPSVVGGTLYYTRAATVYEAAFDVEHRVLRGSPKPLYQGVTYSPETGAAQFAAARDARLFLRGARGWDLYQPIVVGRDGSKTESLNVVPAAYDRVRLSRDARYAVFQIGAADDDLWRYDFERRVLGRITDSGENIAPAFTPDGQYVIYAHHATPAPPSTTIYRRRADGSGEAVVLVPPDQGGRARLHIDVSSDGHTIVYGQYTVERNFDLWLLDTATRETHEWISTPNADITPRFSPDGRWIAYASASPAGDSAIYVQSVAGESRRWQVTTTGGRGPAWRADGLELYFNLDDALYAVSIAAGDDPKPGVPRLLFRGDYFSRFDNFPDGQRFLMLQRVPEPSRGGPLLLDIVPAMSGKD